MQCAKDCWTGKATIYVICHSRDISTLDNASYLIHVPLYKVLFSKLPSYRPLLPLLFNSHFDYSNCEFRSTVNGYWSLWSMDIPLWTPTQINKHSKLEYLFIIAQLKFVLLPPTHVFVAPFEEMLMGGHHQVEKWDNNNLWNIKKGELLKAIRNWVPIVCPY